MITMVAPEEAVGFVEFKSLRRDLEAKHRQLLDARQTDEVRRGIEKLELFMSFLCSEEEQRVCGPDMAIPLLPRD